MIFVNASGWNVVTTNTFFSDKTVSHDTSKNITTADIFNFRQISWWEDNSLFVKHKKLVKQYDSLVKVTIIYKNKIEQQSSTDVQNIISLKSQFIIDSLQRVIVEKDIQLAGSSAIKIKNQDNVNLNSGVSIFFDKMNVLYSGVENPITIFAEDNKKASLDFDNGTIVNTGPGRYILKPSEVGLDTINISYNNKIIQFPVRVKPLLDPVAMIGFKRSGAISSAELKAIGGLIVRLPDSEFYAPFQVVSYKIGASGGRIVRYSEADNLGSRWTGAAKQLIEAAGPGTTIFFGEITVKGPDGKQRSIAPVNYYLQ